MKKIWTIIFPKRHRENQSGFTILEVLIAISILTIGLLAVGQMQIMDIKWNYFSGNTTAALTLAEEKMEDLLGSGYSTVVAADETNVNGIYHRITNVVDSTPPQPTFKTVTVTVGWDNDRHQVSISCIKPQ
jgi:prepilin-type N-terminal cleavage/methylation domain-containing protein